MKLAQFTTKNGPAVGVELNGRWLDYGKAETAYLLLLHNIISEPVASIPDMFDEDGLNVDGMKEVLRFIRASHMERYLLLGNDAKLRAPIERPPKIVALGLNYVLHAKEGNFDVPEEPILFVKVGSSVVGPGETIRIPRGLGRMDHEVELAAVIAKRATGVKKRDAYNYIAGYCICNDVSARDLQIKDLAKKHPWFRSKSFDTFSPLGPWLVTADEFPPPVHLRLECRVNGRLRQRANTRDLIFDLPAIIEYVTRYITLEPGDIISTGTPEGIGPITGGDTVACRIEGIGELKNPVRYR